MTIFAEKWSNLVIPPTNASLTKLNRVDEIAFINKTKGVLNSG